jgi:hypothetical protein
MLTPVPIKRQRINAVLTAYASLRAVLAEHTKFDPNVGAALTLAAAAGSAMAIWSVSPFDSLA